MSRMGADGYSSSNTTRLSAKIPAALKADFRETCEALDVTMTDAIEEQIVAFVEEHDDAPSAPDAEHYPDEPRLRELYHSCLDHADEHLRVYQRHHARSIAESTGLTSKDDLGSDLRPLRKKGYVARGALPVGLKREAAKRWRFWHIKPPAADPDKWTKRENRNRINRERTEALATDGGKNE